MSMSQCVLLRDLLDNQAFILPNLEQMRPNPYLLILYNPQQGLVQRQKMSKGISQAHYCFEALCYYQRLASYVDACKFQRYLLRMYFVRYIDFLRNALRQLDIIDVLTICVKGRIESSTRVYQWCTRNQKQKPETQHQKPETPNKLL